jgi:RNA polymerase sigma-70 factor (ECF subfamily)
MSANQHERSSGAVRAQRVEVAHPQLGAPSPAEISALIEPYRRELLLHCYRMLGSLHDAEDLTQETLVRAWQRFATLHDMAALRAWLYSIATNACLNALKQRARRTLPLALGPAADPAGPYPRPLPEAHWLEPLPASWLTEATQNPEARYTRRESVSLAFLTIVQLLPPRQRAILLLADVLDWRADEIARLLAITVSAVSSALHRARETLARHYHPADREPAPPADAATSALLARYVRAWETDDVAGLVALLQADATLAMPPLPEWYRGRAAIAAVLRAFPFRPGRPPRRWRLFPTTANELPAFAYYSVDPDSGRYQAQGVQTLALDWSTPTGQIADLTLFHNSALVPFFGFPPEMAGE